MMTTTMTPHPGGSSTAAGARFGVLIGLFVVCAFVLHNYVNLNIGLKLALEQAVAYFLQWTIVGSSSVLFTDPRYTIMVNISVVVLHLMIVIDQDLFRDDG